MLGVCDSNKYVYENYVNLFGLRGNDAGQLGLGNTIRQGERPGQMGDSLPAIDFGFGRTAIDISSGWDHNCAILDNGDTKCWGYSHYISPTVF